jgi:hypothetical protein
MASDATRRPPESSVGELALRDADHVPGHQHATEEVGLDVALLDGA